MEIRLKNLASFQVITDKMHTLVQKRLQSRMGGTTWPIIAFVAAKRCWVRKTARPGLRAMPTGACRAKPDAGNRPKMTDGQLRRVQLKQARRALIKSHPSLNSTHNLIATTLSRKALTRTEERQRSSGHDYH